MDKKITFDESNNSDYDMVNKKILEESILLKTISEIRAINLGIIPKMEYIEQIYLVHPKWNEKHVNQIIGRALRK